MDFGLQIPYVVAAERDQFLAWMRRADEGPFRTLSIGDRVTYDNPDLFTALAAAAAVTSRVRLLANVAILPMRAPALAAKAIATIDRLSQGRLIVTGGVGSRPEDFAAVGLDYTGRWQRLDDSIATMRSIWSGHAADPSGGTVGPAPFTPGGPVLHCAATGPKALARAVRWAAGYQGFTTNGSLQLLRGVADNVAGAFAAAGRERPELGVSCFFALGSGATERLRTVVGDYFGFADEATRQATVASLTVDDADAIAVTVANAEAAGFDEVHFLPTTADPAEIDRLEAVLRGL